MVFSAFEISYSIAQIPLSILSSILEWLNNHGSHIIFMLVTMQINSLRHSLFIRFFVKKGWPIWNVVYICGEVFECGFLIQYIVWLGHSWGTKHCLLDPPTLEVGPIDSLPLVCLFVCYKFFPATNHRISLIFCIYS